MVYCSEKEEANKFAKGDKIMEEYIKDAEEASKEARVQRYYDLEEKREREIADQIAHDKKWARIEGLEEGREEGIKEGKKEGIKEEQIKIAKNLLHANISLDIISSSTGLSKKEIENLK